LAVELNLDLVAGPRPHLARIAGAQGSALTVRSLSMPRRTIS